MIRTLKEYLELFNEAVEIEGAQLIGTDYGYDLFKINTWRAACSFLSEDNANRNGGAFINNSEATFNQHFVQGHENLFFFVVENTNRIHTVCIDGMQNCATHLTTNNTRVSPDFSVGEYGFEDSAGNSGRIKEIIPLHLLPNNGLQNTVIIRCSRNNIIAYAGAIPSNAQPTSITLDENFGVSELRDYQIGALAGRAISEVILTDYVRNISENAFQGFIGTIRATMNEDNKPAGWLFNTEDVIFADSNVDPERVAEVAARIKELKDAIPEVKDSEKAFNEKYKNAVDALIDYEDEVYNENRHLIDAETHDLIYHYLTECDDLDNVRRILEEMNKILEKLSEKEITLDPECVENIIALNSLIKNDNVDLSSEYIPENISATVNKINKKYEELLEEQKANAIANSIKFRVNNKTKEAVITYINIKLAADERHRLTIPDTWRGYNVVGMESRCCIVMCAPNTSITYYVEGGNNLKREKCMPYPFVCVCLNHSNPEIVISNKKCVLASSSMKTRLRK